jgi:hypothetical protein
LGSCNRFKKEYLIKGSAWKNSIGIIGMLEQKGIYSLDLYYLLDNSAWNEIEVLLIDSFKEYYEPVMKLLDILQEEHKQNQETFDEILLG